MVVEDGGPKRPVVRINLASAARDDDQDPLDRNEAVAPPGGDAAPTNGDAATTNEDAATTNGDAAPTNEDAAPTNEDAATTNEDATAALSRLARRLANRVNALPETRMRGAVLAEQLQALPIPRAAGIVATIVQRGRQGGPPFELALIGLEDLLRRELLPYDVLVELYRELKRFQGDVAALMLPGHVNREILGEPAPRFPGGRDLTLGERKSLARAAPRDTIDRLLRDPEPHVIRLLLRNPRLLERDVIFLASRRPIVPEIAREILDNARWSVRYRIRRALALNPSVPDAMALRLLPQLAAQHLGELATDPALSPMRRRAAHQLLDQRRADETSG